ncbi:MAG: flagellar basal body rod protein FlgB [Magnetospirillum sp.]|nr:flagellar basal body rod protein FlgB [Magnetospirillum sp.]
MFEKLTLLAMARKKMDWLAQRQEVVAGNIANANTPKFIPKDLKALDFKSVLAETNPAVRPVATNAAHIVPEMQDPNTVLSQKKTYESSPDGNAVVLEEQMAKLGEAKSAYDTAANLFQKQVRMLRLAITSRG